jgi:melanocortin 5 receptor
MAENITGDNAKSDIAVYFTMTVICVIFLVILTGNLLTIVAFVKFHSLRTVRNYFLVSLAVGDIFHGMINLLIVLYMISPADELTTDCRRQGASIPAAMTLVTTILSYLHILIMTVDCFLCIMKPLHYHQLMTPRRANIIIAVIWILSILLGSLYLITEVFITRCKSSTFLDMYYVLLVAVLWTVVVFVVIVMYLQILLVIRQQKRQILAISSHQSNHDADGCRGVHRSHGNMTMNNKRVAMIFMIIVSFIVLWLPDIITSLSVVLYTHTLYNVMGFSTMRMLLIVCSAISFSNSAVNTFIYARMDKEFRKAYITLLQC